MGFPSDYWNATPFLFLSGNNQNQAQCPPKGLRDGVLDLSAGRNGQRQHYSEKAGLARDGQRFHKFKCNLRRSSLPLFASNGFPVLTEIGHRLVALLVVTLPPSHSNHPLWI